jgi:hypothetical protein
MTNPSTDIFEPESAFDDITLEDDTDSDSPGDDVDEVVAILTSLREVGVDVAFEARPVVIPKRKPSSPEMPWEEYLGFLTNYPGHSVRLFSFTGEDARTKARTRAKEVAKRIDKTHPEEKWDITWDSVKEDDSWRVYASYDREFTEAEMAEKHAKQEAQAERGRHASAVRQQRRQAQP